MNMYYKDVYFIILNYNIQLSADRDILVSEY